MLFLDGFSTYTPTWNEDFIIMVENEENPVTFQVMDWNRVEKHELVGFAMISSSDIHSLLEEDNGYECHLSVPVIKAGTVVEGHGHHKCHLNLTVKVLKAFPRAAAAPQKKRVS
jgi:Ca2+-dependent lipid-binding protein